MTQFVSPVPTSADVVGLPPPAVAGGVAAAVIPGLMPDHFTAIVPAAALYDTGANPLIVSPIAPGILFFVRNNEAVSILVVGPYPGDPGVVVPAGQTTVIGSDANDPNPFVFDVGGTAGGVVTFAAVQAALAVATSTVSFNNQQITGPANARVEVWFETLAQMAAAPGPPSLSLAWQMETDAPYEFVPGDVTAVDGWKTVAPTGGTPGRWRIQSNVISIAPSAPNTNQSTRIAAAMNTGLHIVLRNTGVPFAITAPMAISTNFASLESPDGAIVIPDFGANPADGRVFNLTGTDVTIKGIVFDATTVATYTLINRYCIYTAAARTTVEDCRFVNLLSGDIPTVIGTHCVYAAIGGDDLSVVDCSCNAINGAFVIVAGGLRPTVQDNLVSNTAWYSIALYQGSVPGSIITNNQVIGDTPVNGVTLANRYFGGSIDLKSQNNAAVTQSIVANNYISGRHCYGDAIGLESVRNADVSGNVIDKVYNGNVAYTFMTHIRVLTRGTNTPIFPSARVTICENKLTAGDTAAAGIYCTNEGVGTTRLYGLKVNGNTCASPPENGGSALRAVVPGGTNPPPVTITGTPLAAVLGEVRIRIAIAGVRGVMQFNYSLDGGTTWSGNILSAASVALGASGLTANFSNANAYAANNTYAALPQYFSLAIGFHGQDGGISDVQCMGNDVEALPMGTPVDGAIGFNNFAALTGIDLVVLTGNTIRMLGSPTIFSQMGVWLGQYTTNVIVDSNAVTGFEAGLRADASVTYTFGAQNKFTNNVLDLLLTSFPLPADTLRLGDLGLVAIGTRYMAMGTAVAQVAEASVQYPAQRKLLIQSIRVDASAVPGVAHSTVYTLRKNGVNTALTVTLGAAQLTNTATYTAPIDFAAGDFISVTQVPDGAGNIEADPRVLLGLIYC